ncbi:hypothetical protein F1559_004176 [Cyanidiococcus yangmingshanensis]|uniref:Uncharacterized protein n=1 Tax=Cyanidiococcus yangmingshanensis TaxID=2690220 RepID=A0A7J7IFF5_9RHOD|nr:hypothetical protein F1559_004176 [Cyanidiococcus yangmingshanensis]
MSLVEDQAVPRSILRTLRPCEKITFAFPFKLDNSGSQTDEYLVTICTSWVALWRVSPDGMHLVQRQNLLGRVVAACTIPLAQVGSGGVQKQLLKSDSRTPSHGASDGLICMDSSLSLHVFAYRTDQSTEAERSAPVSGLFCRVAYRSLRNDCDELAQMVDRGTPSLFQLRYFAELDRLLLNAGHHILFSFKGIREWLSNSFENARITRLTSSASPVGHAPQEAQVSRRGILRWQAYPALGFVQDAVTLTVPCRSSLGTCGGFAILTISVSSVVRELRSTSWQDPDHHLPSTLLSVFVDEIQCEDQTDSAMLLASLAAEAQESMSDTPEAPLRYDARTQCWRAALPSTYALGLVADATAHAVLVVTSRYVLRVRFGQRSLRPLLESPLEVPNRALGDQTGSSRDFVTFSTLHKPNMATPLLLLTLLDGQLVQCDGSSLELIRQSSSAPIRFSTGAQNDVSLVALGGSSQVYLFRWDCFGSTEWVYLQRPWLNDTLAPTYAVSHHGAVALGLVHAACLCNDSDETYWKRTGSRSVSKRPLRTPSPGLEGASSDPQYPTFWILHQRADRIHQSKLISSDYAIVRSESDPGVLTGSSRMFWLEHGRSLMICNRAFSQADGSSLPIVLHVDESHGVVEDASDSWPLSDEILACFHDSIVVASERILRMRQSVRNVQTDSRIDVRPAAEWKAPARITHVDATPENTRDPTIALICRTNDSPLSQLILVDSATLSERFRCGLSRRGDVTACSVVTTKKQLRSVVIGWSDGALSIFDWNGTKCELSLRDVLFPYQAANEHIVIAIESILGVHDGDALLISLRDGWLLQLDLASGKLYGSWQLSQQPLKLYRIHRPEVEQDDEILVAGHALWRAFWEPSSCLAREIMRVRPLVFANGSFNGVPTAILPCHRVGASIGDVGEGFVQSVMKIWTRDSYVISHDGRLQVVRWHLHRTSDEPMPLLDAQVPSLRGHSRAQMAADFPSRLSSLWACWRALARGHQFVSLQYQDESEIGPVLRSTETAAAVEEAHPTKGAHEPTSPPPLGPMDRDGLFAGADPRTVLALEPSPSCLACAEDNALDLFCMMENGVLGISTQVGYPKQSSETLNWCWTFPICDQDWPFQWADLAVRALDQSESEMDAGEKVTCLCLMQIVIALGASVLYEVILLRRHVSENCSSTHHYELLSSREIRTGMEEVRRAKFLPNGLLLVSNNHQIAFLQQRDSGIQLDRSASACEIAPSRAAGSTSTASADSGRELRSNLVRQSNQPSYWRPSGLYLDICGVLASIQIYGCSSEAETRNMDRVGNADQFPRSYSAYLTTCCSAIYHLAEWHRPNLGLHTERNQSDLLWSGLAKLQGELRERLPCFMGHRIADHTGDPAAGANVSTSVPPEERILDWDILRYWWVLLSGPFSFGSPEASLVRELLRLELQI